MGAIAYFHASLKSKHKQNILRMIYNEDGTIAQTQEEIEKEIMKYKGDLI